MDEHNEGISHFGLDPDFLPQDNIRFDVFHLCCAVTQHLINHLCKFMLCTEQELIESFSQVLQSFWSSYNVLLWIMNKSFAILKGNELLEFIPNSSRINSWLKMNFEETDSLNNICSYLQLWEKITKFMI